MLRRTGIGDYLEPSREDRIATVTYTTGTFRP